MTKNTQSSNDLLVITAARPPALVAVPRLYRSVRTATLLPVSKTCRALCCSLKGKIFSFRNVGTLLLTKRTTFSVAIQQANILSWVDTYEVSSQTKSTLVCILFPLQLLRWHIPMTFSGCFVCFVYKLFICFFILRISSAWIWMSVAWPCNVRMKSDPRKTYRSGRKSKRQCLHNLWRVKAGCLMELCLRHCPGWGMQQPLTGVPKVTVGLKCRWSTTQMRLFFFFFFFFLCYKISLETYGCLSGRLVDHDARIW